MSSMSPVVKLFLNLAKTQSILFNRFDRILGGLGFSEFLILYYLGQTKEQKLRRVDLAEKISMTASGVTRLLLPMEKVLPAVKTKDIEALSDLLVEIGGRALMS